MESCLSLLWKLSVDGNSNPVAPADEWQSPFRRYDVAIVGDISELDGTNNTTLFL